MIPQAPDLSRRERVQIGPDFPNPLASGFLKTLRILQLEVAYPRVNGPKSAGPVTRVTESRQRDLNLSQIVDCAHPARCSQPYMPFLLAFH